MPPSARRFGGLAAGAATALALLCGPDAQAQVQVQPLAQLDLFSVGAKPADVPDDLWKGSSPALARTVIPTIASKPLSPATAALARRVLSAATTGPAGAGNDADLAGARAMALLALGDAATVETIADHTPSLGQNQTLSMAAAEAALIDGADDKACTIGQSLTTGRDGLYWLKLRAYCQEVAKNPAAGLSLQLAEQQGTAPIFQRLMGALTAGTDAGAASLDDGLDYALSRRLGLDLAPAMAGAPAPIVVAILKNPPPAPAPAPQAPAADAAGAVPAAAPPPSGPSLHDLALRRAQDLGLPVTDAGQVDLLAPWPSGQPAGVDVNAPAAVALLAAFTPPVIADARADLAAQDLGPSRAAQGQLLALDLAGEAKAAGDVAMLAILIDEGAEPDGLAVADRARIVRALVKAGLPRDAQAFVAEGMAQPPPPPPPPPKPARRPAAKAPAKAAPKPAAKPASRRR